MQLRSILDQTMLPGELVVCDDGSSDTTIDVLEQFRQQAPFPVRVVRNQERLRTAQNFARCIELCTGDVILLSDQDDVWFPDRVEQTVRAFAADPSLVLTYSDAPLMDQQGKETGQTIYSNLPVSSKDIKRIQAGENLLPVLARYNVLCGATMAFRATLRPVLMPIPQLWMHDEWIGLVANAMGRVHRLQSPVMHYRQHREQQIGAGDWTIRTHMRVARERRSDFYDSEVQRVECGAEAVRLHPELQPVLLPLLEGKRSFYRDRMRIQESGWRGLPLLAKMLLSGRYARYGSSLRSPFKDLFVMLGLHGKPSAGA